MRKLSNIIRKLRTNRITCVIFVLLTSCGKPPPVPDYGIFSKYVYTFQDEALKRDKFIVTGELTVVFGAIDIPKAVGVCRTETFKPPKIIILEEYWRKINELMREQLIFHELAHCLINKPHNDAIGIDGYPVSLMTTYVPAASVYEHKREDMLNELFK